MLPPTPPQEQCPDRGLGKLTGIDNWHTWHMKARMALQGKGLRYLLSDDGPEDLDDFDAANQYDTDRAAAISMLVDAMSEAMLASAYHRGWKPEDATVQSTLNTLEIIVGDEQRRCREEDERVSASHRRLVGLARMDLDSGAQTVREYILAAKHCHEGLLTHYGGGNDGAGSAVAELLEQLFVSSLVEGLRTAKPKWYAEWKEKMTEGTLGSAGTRAGVTEWLLAKDTADQEERDAAAAAAAVAAQPRRELMNRGDKSPAKAATKKTKFTHKGPQRCGYCADRHPQTWPHDDDGCWYLNPHRAPRHWQERFRDEIASVKEGQRRDFKRKRSMSPPFRRI
ncbi:hypothetical protein A9K55_001816 [Cordyceps militaris]|uniref:Uncharacterized protein n=1 Tax=Cordyceps militaris TaxID=73501 RepID=A0A2H4SSL4_CORMI|nr:hypothetical protein A9K55_001816 [Cordyceps militaris]